MASTRAYRGQGRSDRAEQTRGRILEAVRELLEEGRFHDAPVEDVAARAGISRATLYQHFRSRLDLIDAICDTFAVNPALRDLREAVGLPDPDEALARTVALAVRFWASEDGVLAQLYGVEAIDPAARALVERQLRDRRSEMQRLARRLARARRLRPGIGEQRAFELLMMLTSYATFRGLGAEGLSERRCTTLLQDSAATLLLATPG